MLNSNKRTEEDNEEVIYDRDNLLNALKKDGFNWREAQETADAWERQMED